jgi:hypothetical protein
MNYPGHVAYIKRELSKEYFWAKRKRRTQDGVSSSFLMAARELQTI